jgi:hypothetical protein
LLVIEMREFNLQAAFGGGRPFPEDLQDQTGTIDDLTLQAFLEIALLDRTERAIDDNEFCPLLLASGSHAFDLAFAEQGGGAYLAHRHDESIGHHDADRHGEPPRLLESSFGIFALAAAAPQVRAHHKGASAASDFTFYIIDDQRRAPNVIARQSYPAWSTKMVMTL